MNSQSNVKKVIGVVSGKGGVGKSSVTSMLAVAAQRKGYKTAILDADITGPSIPKAFGLDDKAQGNGEVILPVVTDTGIRTMSVNSLLENDTDPVVWRGPILSGVIQQFWNDVVWGDIDIVTSPQELVAMIVEKAIKMADMMNIPVIGLVENMSYFVCPDCGAHHQIFGESHIEEIAGQHGVDVIARLPLDKEVARSFDRGMAECLDVSALADMVAACLRADNPHKHDGMPKPEGCDGNCSGCGEEGCASRT